MNCDICGHRHSNYICDVCDCDGTGKAKPDIPAAPTLQGWKPGWICGKHGTTHDSDCGYTGFREPKSNQSSVREGDTPVPSHDFAHPPLTATEKYMETINVRVSQRTFNKLKASKKSMSETARDILLNYLGPEPLYVTIRQSKPSVSHE